MKKLLSLEICKRLQESWIWQEINTEKEYFYDNDIQDFRTQFRLDHFTTRWIKTFNLEESLTLLKLHTNPSDWYWDLQNAFTNTNVKWTNVVEMCFEFASIEKIELMLIYLIKNNLLIK